MSTIRTQNDGAVRHVIFAREQKRNAMSMQFIADLDAALLDAQTDSSVRCVIIRGDGPMFSAGIDIEASTTSAVASTACAPRATQ